MRKYIFVQEKIILYYKRNGKQKTYRKSIGTKKPGTMQKYYFSVK